VVFRSLSLAAVCLLCSAAPARAQVEESAEVDAPRPVVIAPQILEAVDPDYPEDQLATGIEPVIAMHVTIEADGHVSEAHPEGAHQAGFDEAALSAVRQWRFAPATRDGVAVRSRVRVEVRFRLPLLSVESIEGMDHDPHGDGPHTHDDDPTLRPPDDEAAVIVEPAEAELSAEGVADPMADADAARVVSDFEIDDDVLRAAPRRDAGDLLSSAPGVYAARGEGDAVAHSIYLRGFDAEHGQDIELTLDGIPLNMPSHIHGQGYADLGFLMPEVVRSLRVREGVYDPRQGDFATAGSIDFRLGVADRGVRVTGSYGLFDTFRGAVIVAPEGERDESFVAGSYRNTAGFGEGRAGQEGSALLSWVVADGDFRLRVIGAFAGARYGLAGILRRDDVIAGRVGFYDQYDEPTAAGQGALSIRAILGVTLSFLGERGSFAEIAAWGSYADFRLSANYTGFTEISRVNPMWRGRGDLIEQMNETVDLGARARWRSEPWSPFDFLCARAEVGITGRLDLVSQSQNLIAAPLNQTWDQRVDASIRALDVGAYLDGDVRLWDGVVRVRGGLRADVLSYGVEDRLGNFIPDVREEMYIPGYRRSALGIAVGPRVTVEVRPIEALAFTVGYGEGYRSPQARTLSDGESAPFSRVRSGDLGARLTIDEVLEASVAGFYTSLGYDIAFDPAEGRLETIGPTTRIGAAAAVTTRPTDFLVGAVSATYVHATLDAPPLGSASDPQPPYVAGQLLPYVPPLVVRADLGIDGTLASALGADITGELGAGVTVLSSRPLPFGQWAAPVGTLDVRGAIGWGPVELGIDLYNVTDSRYAAIEYAYASNWSPDEPPSRLPARHFSAGSPFTFMVSLTVQP
jgi:iron complex outermembrane recepter protein